MPINVFKLKAALADLDQKGIEIGDYVCAYWDVDEAYGGGVRSHTGKLSSLDRKTGWFEISPSNKTPGRLRTSIHAMNMKIEKVPESDIPAIEEEIEEQKRPARPAKAKRKENPFLKKAGK